MMCPEHSLNKQEHQWVEPLFTGMDFEAQWKKLEELLKAK